MKQQERTTVIIVTAYGEDNYYQKRYEDIVGIYTSVDNAIRGAQEDGMTNRQKDYLNRINAFHSLWIALLRHNNHVAFQVNYEEETDARRKSCTSSYMFQTFNLD